MARPPRLQVPDGIYHVTARGNERAAIVCNDTDRRAYVELLASTRERYGWRVLSYCLMSNHYHLLAQTPVPNLARGMRQLNGGYAQWFNRRYARVGHLFQGRYGARLVQADEHLLVVTRYIVMNPVSAGICRHPSAWRWSSHRATLGLDPPGFLDIGALLAYFGPSREAARQQYRAYIEESDGELSRHPLVEGDEDFTADALDQLQPAPGIPCRYLRPPPPALETLFASSDRDAAIKCAAECGYSLRQIARHLGVNASTISRRLKRHSEPFGAATRGT